MCPMVEMWGRAQRAALVFTIVRSSPPFQAWRRTGERVLPCRSITFSTAANSFSITSSRLSSTPTSSPPRVAYLVDEPFARREPAGDAVGGPRRVGGRQRPAGMGPARALPPLARLAHQDEELVPVVPVGLVREVRGAADHAPEPDQD